MKHAQSKPIATISSATRIISATHNFFQLKFAQSEQITTVPTENKYSEQIASILFSMNYAYSEPMVTIPTEAGIV